MTLRLPSRPVSRVIAAVPLVVAGMLVPNVTATAATTCLGKVVTIDLNLPDPPNPDRSQSDVILGTPGADVISTGASTTPLVEGDHTDFVCAKGGNDVIFGGAGSDFIDGGGGDDDIDGGDADTATDISVYHGRTPSVVATIDGTAQLGSETDDLSGLEALIGGSGNDTLVGDANDNILVGGNGKDTLKGGAGEDQFVGDDVITVAGLSDGPTGNGADTINGGSDADTVLLGGDHTTGVVAVLGVAGATGNSTDGPSGARDTLTGVENLQGTDGSDTLTGDVADNSLYGAGGADTLNGGDGADELGGGSGADTLGGGTGPDELEGEGGADSMSGGTGDDTLDGGAGADSLKGKDGNDILDAVDGTVDTLIAGGAGVDTAYTDPGPDPKDPTPTGVEFLNPED